MYAQNLIEIAQNTSYNAHFYAFESFLADGGVNDPDMYLFGEPEDFSPEADRTVMSRVEKYTNMIDREPQVIDVPEFDYMLTA